MQLQALVDPPLAPNVQITFRKSEAKQFRETLRDVRSRGIYSLIVDTRPEHLIHFFAAVSF